MPGYLAMLTEKSITFGVSVYTIFLDSRALCMCMCVLVPFFLSIPPHININKLNSEQLHLNSLAGLTVGSSKTS